MNLRLVEVQQRPVWRREFLILLYPSWPGVGALPIHCVGLPTISVIRKGLWKKYDTYIEATMMGIGCTVKVYHVEFW